MIKQDLPRLKSTEWAYIAGLLDGEGCISIWENRSRHKAGSHVLELCITNTHYPTIVWLRKKAGGYIKTQCKQNVKWKDCYRWVLNHRQAAWAIRSCLPFLVTKKGQARIALQYAARTAANLNGGPFKIADKELITRNRLSAAIRLLNRRGKAA